MTPRRPTTPRRSTLALSLFASLALGTLGAVGVFGAGCAREHLSSNYAQAYSAWFSAQHVNRPPANPELAQRTLDSLDAQEAATVSKGYRQAIHSDEGTTGGGRLLMINPNRVGGEAYVPPPSVPGGM
jgi:hypothetical protein